jgi:ligand-binding sensor domain-containing protein/anti-sigma regulatory factor (Ser/Thr protein kinase)
MQDSRGFIWISTRNGLSRFDGMEFKNYYRKDGLPSNYVNGIIEDTSGTIRAYSNAGLSEYTGYGFKFSPKPEEFKDWNFSFGSTIDNNNNIYLLGLSPGDAVRRMVVSENGVYSDFAEQYPALDTMKIIAFCFDRSTNGMIIINDHKNIWLWKENNLTSLSRLKFENVYEDRGYILAKWQDKVYKYVDNKFELFSLNSIKGRSEANYKNSSLNSEIEFFDGRLSSNVTLPFNSIGYMVDNDGMLWFSSEKNLYRLMSTAFRSYSEDEIGTRNIWAIIDDRNGHIWFGSLYGDLIEFDGKNFKKRNEYQTLFKEGIGFFKGSRRMSNGETWFSTNLGVLIWDGLIFSRLKGIPDETQICYIYEDTESNLIMLGTQCGLFLLRNGKIELRSEFIDNNLGVIEGVVKDETGIYWLSGHNGVIKFDGITPVPVKEDVLPDGYTYTIEKDNHGGLWVTSEEGLFFRSNTAKQFVHGLPEALNSSANSIYSLDSTQLLVGRLSDICIIDLKKFYENDEDYFTIYDKTSGFTAADCLDNGIIKTQDGKIWILSSTGVVIFDPDKVRQNPFPPNLHLSSFYFKNDSLAWEPVEKSQFFYGEPDNVKLKRYQNTVRISFIGISTPNPEKVKYRHRLIGYDEKWSLPDGLRFVEYEKLPPGKYCFQIISLNADQKENSEPLSINFRISPAFWETPLFIISSVFLLIILTVVVTVVITRRSQQKKMERDQLNSELSRLQLNSVIKQFDPHFIFNVISSVGSLIMRGEKETAYDYILKLSSLLRTVLNEGSVTVKSLSAELDFVKRYCELQKLRFRDRLIYEIFVNENVDLQRDIPKMTIQTFVENSIKHGLENRMEGGKIEVKIENSRGGISITVTDNGIGRVAARRLNTNGTGFGLKIITGIFDEMNENNIDKSEIRITDMNTRDRNISGTEVNIYIPDSYVFEFGKNRKMKRV